MSTPFLVSYPLLVGRDPVVNKCSLEPVIASFRGMKPFPVLPP